MSRKPLIRTLVLGVIAGNPGATSAEVARVLDLPVAAVRPRVSELLAQHKIKSIGRIRVAGGKVQTQWKVCGATGDQEGKHHG